VAKTAKMAKTFCHILAIKKMAKVAKTELFDNWQMVLTQNIVELFMHQIYAN
jgi:hypothetical protein